MLQQTQVATVLPYYVRFFERFPDVHALASANEESVLAAWSGLGYYSRARSLHRAAKVVVEDHGGRLPGDAVTLRSLPGIGRYTAGAIASIAFGREEPVLDGNVRRVLSRLTAGDGRNESELWALASELVRGSSPGDLNQALMELGATVCRPSSPDCGRCPVRNPCMARATGAPEEYPARVKARPTENVRVAVAVVRQGGRILIERPTRRSPFRGHWDLPAVEIAGGADARDAIVAVLRRRHGLVIDVGMRVGSATHGILHRRLRLEAYGCRVVSGRTTANPELRWLNPGDLVDAAVSGATRKLLARVSQNRSQGGAHDSTRPAWVSGGSGSRGRAKR
jgi:A/G-specific adenine glycosylase